MTCVTPIRPLPEAADNRVPLGHHSSGALHLDLDRLLAGRLLIQGSSGAGKSRTLRRIIEEAFDYTTIAIVDPEGEFENLARHIGATTLRAVELSSEGLTAAAARSRQHRLALHLDLTDLDPDQRIIKAAAFFAGLIGAPREHWANTVLVCIDEGHLLAPHMAGSAQDAEVRRLGVATFTGSSGRIFPVDMKAAPLLRAWLHRLREHGVRFHMRHRWTGWSEDQQSLRFQRESHSQDEWLLHPSLLLRK